MSAEPVDYAAMQKELSEGPGSRYCDGCETVSYDRLSREHGTTVAKFLADGWRHMTTCAGIVRCCAECKAFNESKPWKWIADIEPARFATFCQRNDNGAWSLDVLRQLLPCTHAMFEKPPLGPVDDGGGFRML